MDENGKGVISILRLTDIQDKPGLFSTFMLQLLAEIYDKFPEEGDSDRPKLALFIDEAHLVFKEASDVLLDQIETIVKLIRSKGVGIFFITQNPTDIPEAVLGQLGLKIQHALRAFTAKDREIYFSEDEKTAWFEERLDTWMGPCRGSGTVQLTAEGWKIAHYNLAITVPNDKIDGFLDLIRLENPKKK